ncbi:hypothetical protein M434DRAFT_346671 [Hypoxylon sp. CO27-5]|nr:hypothetical protein M434DRAFT_346671 [Hypoxylon sp. CO27-5]
MDRDMSLGQIDFCRIRYYDSTLLKSTNESDREYIASIKKHERAVASIKNKISTLIICPVGRKVDGRQGVEYVPTSYTAIEDPLSKIVSNLNDLEVAREFVFVVFAVFALGTVFQFGQP